MNVCYMLRCADGTLYTGWTNDLPARLRTHQAGKGGKYTRSRLPVELVYYEEYATKEEAMSREWHLKRLPRAEKLRLLDAAGPCPEPPGTGEQKRQTHTDPEEDP